MYLLTVLNALLAFNALCVAKSCQWRSLTERLLGTTKALLCVLSRSRIVQRFTLIGKYKMSRFTASSGLLLAEEVYYPTAQARFPRSTCKPTEGAKPWYNRRALRHTPKAQWPRANALLPAIIQCNLVRQSPEETRAFGMPVQVRFARPTTDSVFQACAACQAEAFLISVRWQAEGDMTHRHCQLQDGAWGQEGVTFDRSGCTENGI